MIRDYCLGIDTSCYTTSVACVSKQGIVFSERAMLSVHFGERGLRQSEGLFQHVKQLAPILENMFSKIERERIGAVCVSEKPTSADNSYMPVFLAGIQTARALSAALDVPLILTDHQTGHFRAALVGNETLLNGEFIGLHISGGTTDMVTVLPHRNLPYQIELLGSSTDLHAGQFVDRVGVALGFPFPAGKHLELLANEAQRRDIKIPSSVKDMACSFSGAETAACRMMEDVDPSELAYGVYDCIFRTIKKMIHAADRHIGILPVVVCGGVASSALLRGMLTGAFHDRIVFGMKELSTDNAVGVAFIGRDRMT